MRWFLLCPFLLGVSGGVSSRTSGGSGGLLGVGFGSGMSDDGSFASCLGFLFVGGGARGCRLAPPVVYLSFR